MEVRSAGSKSTSSPVKKERKNVSVLIYMEPAKMVGGGSFPLAVHIA